MTAYAATIMVLDQKGRIVRRLVGGMHTSGRHEVRWDGRDDSGRGCASGVYIIVLEADGIRLFRNITLLE